MFSFTKISAVSNAYPAGGDGRKSLKNSYANPLSTRTSAKVGFCGSGQFVTLTFFVESPELPYD